MSSRLLNRPPRVKFADPENPTIIPSESTNCPLFVCAIPVVALGLIICISIRFSWIKYARHLKKCSPYSSSPALMDSQHVKSNGATIPPSNPDEIASLSFAETIWLIAILMKPPLLMNVAKEDDNTLIAAELKYPS